MHSGPLDEGRTFNSVTQAQSATLRRPDPVALCCAPFARVPVRRPWGERPLPGRPGAPLKARRALSRVKPSKNTRRGRPMLLKKSPAMRLTGAANGAISYLTMTSGPLVAITGATGFIGRHLLQQLPQLGGID